LARTINTDEEIDKESDEEFNFDAGHDASTTDDSKLVRIC